MHKNKLWFTLVELIVVIVILGVLATIGFVSYSWYLWGARDGNRITQLKNINDSLNLYGSTKNLPLPDDYVSVTASGTTVWYQWYAGENVLELINYISGGQDPKDDTYYTYYLTQDRKNLQLMALLEESDWLQTHNTINPLIPQTYAADYSNRFPKTYGKKLWVLVSNATATKNTPAQEMTTSDIDLATTTDYTAYLDDTNSIESTSTWALLTTIPNASCNRIKQTWGFRGSGEYVLYSPIGDIDAYCDEENIQIDFLLSSVKDPSFEWYTEETSWKHSYVSSSAARTWNMGIEISGGYYSPASDEYFLIDAKKQYKLSWYFRSQWSTQSRLYFWIYEYDKDLTLISHQHVWVRSNTDTTLSQSVSTSDTSIVINDTWWSICSAWQSGLWNSAVALDTNPTYSDLPNFNIAPSSWYITSVGDNWLTCTINLANPAGVSYESWIWVRQHFYSSSYNYWAASNALVPTSWTLYSATISGQSQSWADTSRFKAWTKYVKILIFANYGQSTDAVLQGDDINFIED